MKRYGYKKRNSIKYKKFPIGIFLLLFLVEAVLATASLAIYFVNSGKRLTSDITEYTRRYSSTMAEAVSDAAALSYGLRQYASLEDLLRNRIQQDLIDEAFFILNDGTIIIHSQKELSENLKGNVGNDEFAYNLDILLNRSLQNNQEVLFCDYNYLDKTIPFSSKDIKLIKNYIYSGITSSGWLTSKAVSYKNVSIGTINFITSKERIHTTIANLFSNTKMYWVYSMVGAFILSFLISILIVLRYRSIQRKTMRQFISSNENTVVRDSDDVVLEDWDYGYSEEEVPSYNMLSDDGEDGDITIDITQTEKPVPQRNNRYDDDDDYDMPSYNRMPPERSRVRDAVPVREILKK